MIVFTAGLGSFRIIDSSEGYYAEAAREMVEAGNYLTPYLNYRPFFEKPILTYWLVAISYKLLGVNELAARLPSAVSAVALVAATYAFARLFFGLRVAVFSALILLSTPYFVALGRLCLTDMPFTALVASAIGSLFCLMEGRKGRIAPFAFVALGMAVLCKGPLAVVLAALVCFLYSLVESRLSGNTPTRDLLGRVFTGLLLSALIAAPWYVAESLATGGDFAREFFLTQNLGRATGSTVHHNPQPWYYLPYVIGGCAPWSLFIISGAWILFRCAFKGNYRSTRARALRFAAVWAMGMFVFFSAVPTKLGTYILPVIPAGAIIGGALLDTVVRLRRIGTLKWTSAAIACAGAALVFVVPFLLKRCPDTIAANIATTAVCAAGCARAFAIFARGRGRAATWLFVASLCLGVGVLVPVNMVSYYKMSHAGFHELIDRAKAEGAAVATMGPSVYSAAFYLKRAVPKLENRADVHSFLESKARAHWILISKARLEQLSWLDRTYTLLDRKGKWSLYAVGAKPELKPQL